MKFAISGGVTKVDDEKILEAPVKEAGKEDGGSR
jgi:hypothetical protein